MIIAVPPKTLNADQKGKLAKKGYVVIEIDDPEKVKVINIESPIATNDMMMAMLHALANTISEESRTFVRELNRRLKAQETVTAKPTTNEPTT